jgi:hypothetical protein
MQTPGFSKGVEMKKNSDEWNLIGGTDLVGLVGFIIAVVWLAGYSQESTL